MSLQPSVPTASGTLHVVATPIGNLDDISLRALRVLRECHIVAAEDTRHTGRLLAHFGIKKPLISVHRFSEASRSAELMTLLAAGKNIALVSDAGTPGISDPGERLINLCVANNVPIIMVPGPSAVLHALVISGLPTTPFFFAGFLPARKSQRLAALAELCNQTHTSVFFESPHRILDAIVELCGLAPEKKICVTRELTKIHEEVLRGTVAAAAELLQRKAPRGEYTVVLEGTHRP